MASYVRTWFHGRRGSLTKAIERYGSLYLTQDWEFARGYGTVYRINLRSGLRILDTSNDQVLSRVVGRLFRAYKKGDLPLELDQWLERAAADFDDPRDVIEEALSPAEIRTESAYDMAELQEWLSDVGFQLVTFWGEDTALLLDAAGGVKSFTKDDGGG